MYRRKTLGLSNVDRIKKRKLLKSGFTPSKLNKTGCKILNLGDDSFIDSVPTLFERECFYNFFLAFS